MLIEDLTMQLIKEMSDEEVAMWFSAVQQQEQVRKMRQALLQFVDLRDNERATNTIKIPSRVVE